MKTKNISDIKDFINSVQKYLPENVVKKAISVIPGNQIAIFRLPILTTDRDVLQFIHEYHLERPENMIQFFVELYFENLIYIADAFNELKELDQDKAIAYIESAKNTYQQAKESVSKERKENLIANAQAELNRAIAILKSKVMHYINEQRKIDGMNRFKRALKAKQIVRNIDSNNNLAKEAIRAIMSAVSLQFAISHEIENDNFNKAIIAPYDSFKSELLSNGNPLFMYDYDKDYNDGFWINLADIMNTVNTAAEITMDLSDYDDDDIDYENLVF